MPRSIIRPARHKVLFAESSDRVVSLCENAVRTGWILSDLRAFLRPHGEGSFLKWASSRFEISTTHAAHLMALSRHFARDLVDKRNRERLSISVPGLNPTALGQHLRNQVTECQPKSLSQLFREVGILPALPDRNGHRVNPTIQLRQIESLLEQFGKKAVGVNPDSIPALKREELLWKLKPIISFYSKLKALDP
jgi:hypothetical protein